MHSYQGGTVCYPIVLYHTIEYCPNKGQVAFCTREQLGYLLPVVFPRVSYNSYMTAKPGEVI